MTKKLFQKKKKPHPYAGEVHEYARQRAVCQNRLYELEQMLLHDELSEEERAQIEKERNELEKIY